jgi:hypothetical protein
MPFTEDLTPFFTDFAVSAVLGGVVVAGIFDRAYQSGSVGVAGFASTQPVLTLPTASLAGDPVGLALVVNASTYSVVAHEPDGTGISLLMLEAA